MKRWGLISEVVLLSGITMLGGQDFKAEGRLYQVLGPAVTDSATQSEGFPANQVVRNKPFTATEERRTIQILRDGTRIDNSERNRLFRDRQGRTRMEEMNGMVTIFDPVAGFRAELDPSAKIARMGGANSVIPPILIDSSKAAPNSKTTKGVTPQVSQNLKPQLVNGIMTQGIRTTMTIPKGQIGNDRQIKVVTERWISDDLQMLIKSVNTDPRYGETTYQLIGISQREPEPLLFQIPSEYTIIPEAGRGGRSPVPGGRNGGPGGRVGPGGRGGRSPDPQVNK